MGGQVNLKFFGDIIDKPQKRRCHDNIKPKIISFRDGSVGELETRIKGGKGGLVSSGIPGEPGYYIPDQTLAQLTVKELNKRVSQVSHHLLLSIICVL